MVDRPNRFTLRVKVGREIKTAHLSDTGRLKELLLPGRPVYLIPNPNGKLDYKAVGVEVEGEPILLSPAHHSFIAQRLIEGGVLGFKPTRIEREVEVVSERGRRSRLDFRIDSRVWVEVKGCNLKVGERCLFPDAPTSRGALHLRHLLRFQKMGQQGVVMFLLFRDCSLFSPNQKRDPTFSLLLRRSVEAGIELLPLKLQFAPFPSPLIRYLAPLPYSL